jgi:predicted dehydrogenase
LHGHLTNFISGKNNYYLQGNGKVLMEKIIKIGIVGSATRGSRFKSGLKNRSDVKVQAVCDINSEKLEESRLLLEAEEKYTDYSKMIKEADIQAVIIGTPMPFHAPQAIEALKQNIHVFSEVPAAVSLKECRELVRTAGKSEGIYMMGENYTYMKQNVLVRELAGKGLFGRPYYAEGEYIHELKELNEITVWRRKWQTGINGITYGTHSLGPILEWMQGDRVKEVCCKGSGHHYKDPRGNYYENEDSCVMLCKMEKGGLVKIRVDMISDRPTAATNYSLQGTDGCYESARSEHEKDKIWLRSRCRDNHTWMDTAELEEEFLPEYWKNPTLEVLRSDHGGGDFFEIFDFIDAIQGKKSCPIDIHKSMDMTVPGLVSQESILKGGKWLPVPDSRTW